MRLQRMVCVTVGIAGVMGAGTPLSAAPAVDTGADTGRLTEASGGFSYVPPVGWKVAALPGLKYKISFSRPINGFAPNINVVDQPAAMPLDRYVRLNVTQMTQILPGFHLLGQTAFRTISGIQGARLLAEDAQNGRKLRQIFYLFAGHGARKLVVTASMPASEGAKFDRAIDVSMKTFTLK